VAEEYVRRIYDELRDKPLDRELLDRFSQQLRGRGSVCDIGCGPGHVARYLHDRGAQVCGLDLSLNMLLHAKRLNPAIHFIQGDVLKLGVADGAWAGITAFYCICNLPPADLPAAFAEMRRVLRPGGLLLLSFHIGDEVKHLDEWWGLRCRWISTSISPRRCGRGWSGRSLRWSRLPSASRTRTWSTRPGERM
jgi:SAM-dependent methyltransferase